MLQSFAMALRLAQRGTMLEALRDEKAYWAKLIEAQAALRSEFSRQLSLLNPLSKCWPRFFTADEWAEFASMVSVG